MAQPGKFLNHPQAEALEPGGTMARLFWLILVLAFVAALLAGASWTIAYNTVGSILGAPPPKMGTQTTHLLWNGVGHEEKHPFMWRFAFGPTVIPGATRVTI